MEMYEVTTNSEEETRQFGAELAKGLKGGEVLLLHGPLGAGKTCLVKGVCQGLGLDKDEASSPTFTLVNEYSGGRLKVFHVDLYRLEKTLGLETRGLETLGLEEMLGRAGSVCLVEWGEKLGSMAPDKAVDVTMRRMNEGSRKITVSSK
jgi:tRNA threonylcarbamoyladenosine biosynthesis protein TsaE